MTGKKRTGTKQIRLGRVIALVGKLEERLAAIDFVIAEIPQQDLEGVTLARFSVMQGRRDELVQTIDVIKKEFGIGEGEGE